MEDNPGDIRLAEEMLTGGDLDPTIHVVTDGSDAIDFLTRSDEYTDAPRPDVILLDLHLPRMDGEEVLIELDEKARCAPVIVLSGSQQGADLKLDDVEVEVDARVEKPLEAETFKHLVRSFE
ncbi:response regulator receiver protein [Halobiforma nitratireducens JCM 10879]|uniref:Response regulator receiver protein n=1 Tax=Halobiforma nitratireducens JCM 10879 TaxID=1227454 RepID=M0M3K1_9EURY|nr:response regulator receiver protein [Halobiforma nitratireducens JCM 10879]